MTSSTSGRLGDLSAPGDATGVVPHNPLRFDEIHNRQPDSDWRGLSE
jgi:hypothetical protein